MRCVLPVFISIHALLAESDRQIDAVRFAGLYFYPRSPCGERLPWPGLRLRCADFYPRSPCGERLPCPSWARRTGRNFYPRSPCGERPSRRRVSGSNSAFLSTLSLRRATVGNTTEREDTQYFYPRSPCGERLQYMDARYCRQGISIHALLAESDSKSAQNSGALLRI